LVVAGHNHWRTGANDVQIKTLPPEIEMPWREFLVHVTFSAHYNTPESFFSE
jgi:hypothetical protein